MTRYLGDPAYVHGTPERLGILLVNLGTPAAPTAAAVRRYLAEFLWDPRVVEAPRWLWWLALHGFILRWRPARSAHAYRQIWTPEGSPLRVHTEALAAALRAALAPRLAAPFTLAVGMRYGAPALPAALETLRAAHVRRLLVLPLYPQYSATTTASAFDAVTAALARWRWLPETRFINQYHDAAGYIAALATAVREHWARHGRGERLLFSFHGLPRRYLLAGDPYHCQCQKTARLVAEQLGLAESDWAVAFQSRVGGARWLEPYTEDLLRTWGQARLARVDVLCPGFATDCLETLEEIALRARAGFVAAGGGELRYIPALNAHPAHVAFLTDLICAHLQGWPEAAADRAVPRLDPTGDGAAHRARRLGATR